MEPFSICWDGGCFVPFKVSTHLRCVGEYSDTVKFRDAAKRHPTFHRPGGGQIMTPFSFLNDYTHARTRTGEPLIDSWVTLTTCLTVPQSCSPEENRNRKRNTN